MKYKCFGGSFWGWKVKYSRYWQYGTFEELKAVLIKAKENKNEQ